MNDLEKLRARINELEEENSLLKQNHLEINQAKELYLKIFEEFPALIWRSRLDKLCDYFNKTWLEFTGRTMEQEFGNGWAEGVHPDDFNFCLETYVNAFDKREAFIMEYRMKNKSGEYRWIRDFGRPFYDLDDSFLGYIGSCYDITENKNIELKLIELNAAKDKLFSIISHDLRGPIGSFKSLIEFMLSHLDLRDTLKLREILQAIQSSATSTYDLLENLLSWARFQNKEILYSPANINVNNIFKDCISVFNLAAGKKGITIHNLIPENHVVFGDAAMLMTVIRNLLSNAIKFTPVNRKIYLSVTEDGKNHQFCVRDEGVGIKESDIGKLFNAAAAYTTNGTAGEKGSGLGLMLCREFIEKHGGKIWVESEPGKGSQFKFTLPLLHSGTK